jgi:hypothetical protein
MLAARGLKSCALSGSIRVTACVPRAAAPRDDLPQRAGVAHRRMVVPLRPDLRGRPRHTRIQTGPGRSGAN